MVRQENFSTPHLNTAALLITPTQYDKRALTCTDQLTLTNSLFNLSYMTSVSTLRIAYVLASDGGLELIVRILTRLNSKPSTPLSRVAFSAGLTCLSNVAIRGNHHLRRRLVEAGVVPVIVELLVRVVRVLRALKDAADSNSTPPIAPTSVAAGAAATPGAVGAVTDIPTIGIDEALLAAEETNLELRGMNLMRPIHITLLNTPRQQTPDRLLARRRPLETLDLLPRDPPRTPGLPLGGLDGTMPINRMDLLETRAEAVFNTNTGLDGGRVDVHVASPVPVTMRSAMESPLGFESEGEFSEGSRRRGVSRVGRSRLWRRDDARSAEGEDVVMEDAERDVDGVEAGSDGGMAPVTVMGMELSGSEDSTTAELAAASESGAWGWSRRSSGTGAEGMASRPLTPDVSRNATGRRSSSRLRVVGYGTDGESGSGSGSEISGSGGRRSAPVIGGTSLRRAMSEGSRVGSANGLSVDRYMEQGGSSASTTRQEEDGMVVDSASADRRIWSPSPTAGAANRTITNSNAADLMFSLPPRPTRTGTSSTTGTVSSIETATIHPATPPPQSAFGGPLPLRRFVPSPAPPAPPAPFPQIPFTPTTTTPTATTPITATPTPAPTTTPAPPQPTTPSTPPPPHTHYRIDDILLSIKLVAYLSKYPHLRSDLHTQFAQNVFELVEQFTVPVGGGGGSGNWGEVRKWAVICMRNAFKRDGGRGEGKRERREDVDADAGRDEGGVGRDDEGDEGEGRKREGVLDGGVPTLTTTRESTKPLRRCGHLKCGKVESHPREFSKCSRCRRVTYCSKVCQKTAWRLHKNWCLKCEEGGK
ncbi:hypothetical protein HDV00_003985 [Rhizophlyctis rosea]|nr:hypothetical protein HDV00_003985 [Rhizophlyctis rosea]